MLFVYHGRRNAVSKDVIKMTHLLEVRFSFYFGISSSILNMTYVSPVVFLRFFPYVTTDFMLHLI